MLSAGDNTQLFNTYKCLRTVLLSELCTLVIHNVINHNKQTFDAILCDIDTMRQGWFNAHKFKTDYCPKSQSVSVQTRKNKTTSDKPRSISYMCEVSLAYNKMSGYEGFDRCVLEHKQNVQRLITQSNILSISRMSGMYDNILYVERHFDTTGRILQSRNKEKRRIPAIYNF